MFCSWWSLNHKWALRFYTWVKKNYKRKSTFIYIHDITWELTWPRNHRNQGQYLYFSSRIWQCDQKPHKMNIQLLVGIYRSLCRFWGLIIPRKAQWCLVIAMRHRSFWRSFPWSSSYPYYLLLKLLQKAHQDYDLHFPEWVAQHAESGAGWSWALPKGIYQQVVAWSPWQADQIHQLWYVQHMILDEGVHWAWDADQGLHPVDYHLLGIW